MSHSSLVMGLSDRDAFNHEAFAETILKLLARNKPPLSIGLFGAWGDREVFDHKHSSSKDPGDSKHYIEGYLLQCRGKYSGDSFRRQFLIEVARQVYGESHEEVRRIEQLNYSQVLKKSHQQNLPASIARALKDAFSVKFAFSRQRGCSGNNWLLVRTLLCRRERTGKCLVSAIC